MFDRACNSGKRQAAGNGINSQDQLLSQSTDDQEEYSLVVRFFSLMKYVEIFMLAKAKSFQAFKARKKKTKTHSICFHPHVSFLSISHL